MKEKIRVCIVGATGYSGVKLVEILSKHPEVEIKSLCSSSKAGESFFKIEKKFLGQENKIPEILIHPDNINYQDIDCLFTATPNGVSSKLVNYIFNQEFKFKKPKIIDLSADFRFNNESVFNEWYSPLKALNKNILNINTKIAYGLPEFNRENIKNSEIIANPGCYPTATALALLPLVRENIISQEEIIIVDAKSGVSGAGKKLEEDLLFCSVSDSFKAYNILKHGHTPEIEQSLNLFGNNNFSENNKIKFTPHLLPINQGILVTSYSRPNKNIDKTNLNDKIKSCFESHYKNEKFVQFVEYLPTTSEVRETNNCRISCFYDDRSDLIICISVIDNLIKGASGQAVQNFNIIFNLPETLGLN